MTVPMTVCVDIRMFSALETFLCFLMTSGINICYPAGKAKVINRAVQDIGMGPYQWGLFVLCGLGWVADK